MQNGSEYFFLKKRTNPSLFLLIFVLFKLKFYWKTAQGFSGIQTRITRVEGKHADTTKALVKIF